MQPHWHWTRGFLIHKAGIHVPSLGCDRLSVSCHPLGKGVQDSKSKKLIKVHDFSFGVSALFILVVVVVHKNEHGGFKTGSLALYLNTEQDATCEQQVTAQLGVGCVLSCVRSRHLVFLTALSFDEEWMFLNMFFFNRYLEETSFCLLSLEAWRKCRANLWCSSYFISGVSVSCSGWWAFPPTKCAQNKVVVPKNSVKKILITVFFGRVSSRG